MEDLHSQRVVGWSMSDRIDSRLVVDALEMAIARRLPSLERGYPGHRAGSLPLGALAGHRPDRGPDSQRELLP